MNKGGCSHKQENRNEKMCWVFFPPEFHIPISIPHMWLFFKMTILFKAGKKHNNPGIIYTKLGNLFFKDEANAEVASMFASRDSLTLYTQSAI